MATILFLNNTQVYPDGNQTIKLTRENPYFTQSDSYTLDVTLPMDILQNRRFFQNLHRQDRSKQPPNYTCRLLVDNRPVLVGTATVTQVTQLAVKVQLLGGKSEINFLAKDGGAYLDEMDIGRGMATYDSETHISTHITTEGVRFWPGNVFDETVERVKGTRWLCLVDLVKFVITKAGFTITKCDIDKAPWDCIYICSAAYTYLDNMEKILPHWLTSEFITEACRFFNVTVIASILDKTAQIVSNKTFFPETELQTLEPVDEYTAEITSDLSSTRLPLANANISFSMSGSSHHDYDCLDENIREVMKRREYDSYNAAYSEWENMATDVRRQYAFCTPEGMYASWVTYNDEGEETDEDFVQIDMFAPLVRDDSSDNYTELKIVPVAINDEKGRKYGGGGVVNRPTPSMENPAGDFCQAFWDDEESETHTLQEYITGEASTEKSEKEDRMQVCFLENTHVRNVFTDQHYKKDTTPYQSWSLSLNTIDRTHYLGQLHQNGFSFNIKAKHTFRFLADTMPDPTHVYIIRGKKYGCEKIEASVDADGFDRLMTGYFYEMLS